jgi:hypothetical protein
VRPIGTSTGRGQAEETVIYHVAIPGRDNEIRDADAALWLERLLAFAQVSGDQDEVTAHALMQIISISWLAGYKYRDQNPLASNNAPSSE